MSWKSISCVTSGPMEPFPVRTEKKAASAPVARRSASPPILPSTALYSRAFGRRSGSFNRTNGRKKSFRQAARQGSSSRSASGSGRSGSGRSSSERMRRIFRVSSSTSIRIRATAAAWEPDCTYQARPARSPGCSSWLWPPSTRSISGKSRRKTESAPTELYSPLCQASTTTSGRAARTSGISAVSAECAPRNLNPSPGRTRCAIFGSLMPMTAQRTPFRSKSFHVPTGDLTQSAASTVPRNERTSPSRGSRPNS